MQSKYDAIFADDDGTQSYYKWISKYLTNHDTILEAACGTGDLFSLFMADHSGLAFDLDEAKITDAKTKFPHIKEVFFVDDFLNMEVKGTFDLLYCVNDSCNYILNETDLEKFVEETCEKSDLILLDSHHPYRLSEFEEPYLEEGTRNGIEYSYQISTQDDFLIHIINYLDGTFESVFQWVFPPELLIKLYEKQGYEVEVFTDFDEKGIQNIGEKLMYVAQRKVKK